LTTSTSSGLPMLMLGCEYRSHFTLMQALHLHNSTACSHAHNYVYALLILPFVDHTIVRPDYFTSEGEHFLEVDMDALDLRHGKRGPQLWIFMLAAATCSRESVWENKHQRCDIATWAPNRRFPSLSSRQNTRKGLKFVQVVHRPSISRSKSHCPP
jgi:hypothetical protein